jgi:hypothetical protein
MYAGDTAPGQIAGGRLVVCAAMPGAHGALARLRAADCLGPVVVVALVLAAFIGVRLHTYGGDATGFVQFGHPLAAFSQAPPDARFAGGVGYDGQFYWRQAHDPLLVHEGLIRALRSQHGEYRASRLAYPLLAGALALGRDDLLPWTLLLLDAFAVLALTAGTAAFMRAEGRSGWWALGVGLAPGLLLATLRDLSDPLAVAAAAGGLMAWRRDRRALATALLVLAVMTREPMVLAVAALALEAVLAAWRAPCGAQRRAPLRRAAPVVLVPLAVFLAWQAYVTVRFGGVLPPATSPSRQFGAPFGWFPDAIRAATRVGAGAAAWNLAYLALLVLAVAGALVAALRRRTLLALAAGLFAVDATIEQFGADKWGYTRQTALLFVLVALIGVVERRRWALATAGLAAGLTILIPLGFSATSGA